jgi:hypothetical protein
MNVRRVLTVCFALAMLAAACGGDEVSAETTAFCDAVRNVDTVFASQDPEADPAVFVDEVKTTMNAALTAAPDDVRPSVETLVTLTSDALDSGGDTFGLALENEDFKAANTAVDDWMVENCGYADHEVIGVDYAYSGMPEAVKSGIAAVRFDNQGTEVHEMVLMRINDGVTETLDELLALSEEESNTKVEFLGVTFALPDTADTAFYDLEPGRYGYFCFLPEGSTPDKLGDLMSGAFEGGPPHFTLGMKGEFTVED